MQSPKTASDLKISLRINNCIELIIISLSYALTAYPPRALLAKSAIEFV